MTKLRGLFNVDYILDRSGVAWLLEINPRWSGSSELIERRLMDRHQLNGQASLFGLSVDALGVAEQGLGATWPGPQTKVPCDPSASSTHGSSIYLKRVVFAGLDMRFDRTRFTGLVGRHESLHDVPHDGTLIRRGNPVLTLITTIEANAIDPMGSHRVALRNIDAAIKRCAADNYSPRSSAYE